MGKDTLDQLVDDNLRRTALLKMTGLSDREIADQMNCSVSRVRQRLRRIRKKLKGKMRIDD